VIQVKDSGLGMTEKTVKRIFEPFFTTKETGKGTGLGLSMVYGIIDKMGGKISVVSKPGAGTTFEIMLPLLQAEAKEPVSEESVDIKAIAMDACVLLVDDEVLLREVGEGVLKACGFDVITASSGEEALAILASDTLTIDVVLLDLNMPGLGGRETLRQIRRNNAYTKVIILSGYSEDILDSNNRELHYDGFLSKPYLFNDIYTEVSRVLKFTHEINK